MSDAPRIHPFEASGLGLAPFRFVAFTVMQYRAHADAPVQPGSSCEYCGQAISNVCVVQSADGHKFHVGTDCVLKTGQPGATSELEKEVAKVQATLRREQNEKRRVAKWEKAVAARNAARAALDTDPSLLADQPHPVAERAAKGATLRDYATWCLQNGGANSWGYVTKVLAKGGA